MLRLSSRVYHSLLVCICIICADIASVYAGTNIVSVTSEGRIINPRMGVHSHLTRVSPLDDEFSSLEKSLSYIRDLGCAFVRFGFPWKKIQPQQNHWQWSRWDAAVSEAKVQGISILAVIHAPPAWASPPHRHIDSWKRFIKTIVQRYGDDVAAWEIWNEPNVKKFWSKSWTPRGYVDLLQASHAIIKAHNPNAVVVLGGMANKADAFDTWQRWMALGAGNYADAVGFHPYKVTGQAILPLYHHIRTIVSKPIWATEYGWRTWRPPLHPAHSDALASLVNYGARLHRSHSLQKLWVLSEFSVSNREQKVLLHTFTEQISKLGWQVKELSHDVLLRVLQQADAQDHALVLFQDALPKPLASAVINFVAKGGYLATLGGWPFSVQSSEQALHRYGHQLLINWRKAPKEHRRVSPKALVNHTPLKFPESAPISSPWLLQGSTNTEQAEYLPLIGMRQGGKYRGDVAALMRYKGSMRGNWLAVTSPAYRLPQHRKDATYQEHADHILQTYLLHLVEGEGAFFIYELRDDLGPKHLGLFEHDFTPKDAARAIKWLNYKLGSSITLHEVQYFNDGALLEFTNDRGHRYAVTWGHQAYVHIRNRSSNVRYEPETWDTTPSSQLQQALEHKDQDALRQTIFWRRNPK